MRDLSTWLLHLQIPFLTSSHWRAFPAFPQLLQGAEGALAHFPPSFRQRKQKFWIQYQFKYIYTKRCRTDHNLLHRLLVDLGFRAEVLVKKWPWLIQVHHWFLLPGILGCSHCARSHPKPLLKVPTAALVGCWSSQELNSSLSLV